MKPIVVIRHQPSAPLGIAATALDEAGVTWRYRDAWKAAEWPDLDDVSGLIALGGARRRPTGCAASRLLCATHRWAGRTSESVPYATPHPGLRVQSHR